MGFDDIDKHFRPRIKLECVFCDSTDDVQSLDVRVFPVGDEDIKALCADCRKDRQDYIDQANG